MIYQLNGKKWKKRGETFPWNELRENFIKNFSFISQNEKLVETAKQIKMFIELTRNNGPNTKL